ncbi:MAG: hypothetical protein P8178_02185 [Candidatus Thiodiazotropha sp.]
MFTFSNKRLSAGMEHASMRVLTHLEGMARVGEADSDILCTED